MKNRLGRWALGTLGCVGAAVLIAAVAVAVLMLAGFGMDALCAVLGAIFGTGPQP